MYSSFSNKITLDVFDGNTETSVSLAFFGLFIVIIFLYIYKEIMNKGTSIN